jgi:LPXTG-site transpeptidase (sortase) family protein
MLKFFLRLLAAGLFPLVFLAGTAFGVYYHAELAVLLSAYTGYSGLLSTPTAWPSPVSFPATNSYLEVPALPSPLPLVFSDTLEEGPIQDYLKHGAVVLPLGTAFGEPGNVVVTAHSTGSEAFGPYRFAFAELSELEAGDEFSIHHQDTTYTYRVYGQEVVWPHEVDKLPNDDRSTVTLVTCWPLWTNFKRLLVHSELVGKSGDCCV